MQNATNRPPLPGAAPYVYREGIGQDPAIVQAMAETYGWPVKWPEKQLRDYRDPVCEFLVFALGLLWFVPAVCWAFPKRRTVAGIVAVIVALSLQVVANAVTAAASLSGGNAMITGTYDAETHKVNFNWSHNGDNPAYQSSVQIRVVNTFGAYDTVGSNSYSNAAPAPGSSGSAEFVGPFIGKFIFVQAFVNGFGVGFVVDEQWAEITATYSITFTIPANNSERDVDYVFVQDGETVASTSTAPGEAEHTYTVTGLTSAAKVYMFEIQTVTEWIEDPLNPGHYILGSNTVTGSTQQASGVPAIGGATASNTATTPGASSNVPGSSSPVKSPDAPAPTPAPATPTPSPSPGVSSPTPFSTPFGSTETTDSTGAKTQDVANSTNAIVEALNQINLKNNLNANGIIDAVNSAKLQGTSDANGIVNAVNVGTTATIGGLNAVVGALNSLKAQLVSQANQENSAGNVSAPAGMTDPSGQTAVWNPGELNLETKLTGVLPIAPTIETTVSSATEILIAFEIPVPHGSPIQIEESIDFAAAPWATPIGIFRTIQSIFVTLGFYVLTFFTVRGAFTTAK
jgi:hypothetical protein